MKFGENMKMGGDPFGGGRLRAAALCVLLGWVLLFVLPVGAFAQQAPAAGAAAPGGASLTIALGGDNDPANVPALARKAMKACEVLGIEPTPTNARRIAGIIVDGLPDLIRMPSAQPAQLSKASYGQRKVRANGEVLSGDDIRVELPTGVAYG